MLKDKIKIIAEELYNKGAENQNLYDNMGYDVSQAVDKILEAIEKDKVEVEITGETTDGYHTFNELYEHRIILFIQLCKCFYKSFGLGKKDIWCSVLHSDGTPFDGWFIVGIFKEKGKQITYHLPLCYWNEVCKFAEVLEKAPEWDGHTSKDVLTRLKYLFLPKLNEI